MATKPLSIPRLINPAWEELTTLVVCLGLDFIELLAPALMAPLIGDILDLAGVVFCAFYLRMPGFITLLELIPGLDVLPIFTVAWLIWYVFKKRRDRARMEHELELWR